MNHIILRLFGNCQLYLLLKNEEKKLLLGMNADLQANLNTTISQQVETENRIVEINRQLNVTPETISHGDEIENNPFLINSLATKLAELQSKPLFE